MCRFRWRRMCSSAVFKLHQRAADILRLDLMVGNLDLRGHRLRFAHDPLQNIDGMNRLVHQRTAAVPFPGAAPAAVGQVVIVVAIPFDHDVADDQIAQTSFGYSLLGQRNGRFQTVLENAAQFFVIFVKRRNRRIDGFQRNIQGLFRQAMLAGLGNFNGHLGMHAAGRNHADQINIVTLEHFFIVRIVIAAILLSNGLRLFLVDVANSNQVAVFCHRIAAYMRSAASQADDRRADVVGIALGFHPIIPPMLSWLYMPSGTSHRPGSTYTTFFTDGIIIARFPFFGKSAHRFCQMFQTNNPG